MASEEFFPVDTMSPSKKLRILRGGAYPELPRWTLNAITCSLVRKRQRKSQHRRGGANITTEAELGVIEPQVQEYLESVEAGGDKE